MPTYPSINQPYRTRPRLIRSRLICGGLWALAQIFSANTAPAQPAGQPDAAVDLTGFVAASGFTANAEGRGLTLTWAISPTETGQLQFNLEPARPLIAHLGVKVAGTNRDLLKEIDPLVFLTIGSRNLQGPGGWMSFFDNPALRPHRTAAMKFNKQLIRVTSAGTRLKVVVSQVAASSFEGNFEFTLFQNSPLIFAEAVLQTEEDGCALLYDAGLGTPTTRGGGLHTSQPNWKTMAWLDETNHELIRARVDMNRIIAPVPVARRTIVAETPAGSVALFPPPHQYLAPSDFSSNLGFVWHGRSGNPQFSGYGFGIHQSPDGDRRFAPWYNAPPRTEQRLGIFYLVSSGDAGRALEQVGRYTHDDRFKALPGHVTFSSHYHIEHTLQLAGRRKELGDPAAVPEDLREPGFVRTFKARGIDIVHLAEFHIGAMPRLPLAERLPLLKLMFDECERLSDEELLLIPGEEANVHLGGHWLAMFPKPVYWGLNRPSGAPFASEIPGYGRVYQVSSSDDVLKLMEQEHGLMWTAHARIKSSRGFPELYQDTAFYQSDRFLGAAWKSMPVDLSLPRLGTRVLDLQDDMANRGERKYIMGEADLFDITPEMETYGHLNINYLKLDQAPRYQSGWQPVMDALRGGKFFVSTGEVLIPDFTVDGKASGEVVTVAPMGPARLQATVDWTFPLNFAEIVSGDGQQIHRQRIDLGDTPAFGTRKLDIAVNLEGRTWVRLEVWDIARNGAFTPPIWLE